MFCCTFAFGWYRWGQELGLGDSRVTGLDTCLNMQIHHIDSLRRLYHGSCSIYNDTANFSVFMYCYNLIT